MATLPVAAQQNAPIQLESNDGRMSISGQLLSVENNVYILQTEDLGTLRIQAGTVTCTGVLCTNVDQAQTFGPKFGIYGSRTVGTTLIPNLLRGYAQSVNATYEIQATDEPLPLSCNEDEVGRERNRRVEVWLRLPNSRSILR